MPFARYCTNGFLQSSPIKTTWAFLSIYCKLIGLELGLDLVRILAHAWPIETCHLKSTVKADFFAELAGSVMYFL